MHHFLSAPLRLLMALALLAGLTVQPLLPPGSTGRTALAAGATISTISTNNGQPGSAVTFVLPPALSMAAAR